MIKAGNQQRQVGHIYSGIANQLAPQTASNFGNGRVHFQISLEHITFVDSGESVCLWIHACAKIFYFGNNV